MSNTTLPSTKNMVSRPPPLGILTMKLTLQGPVVRIAPNELSFSSPDAALELFKTGKGFHKTDFYGVFPPPENPDIFTETREAVHGVKKRYASTPYSLASMQQSTPRIEETERLLLSKMDRFADGNQICDLGEWLHFFRLRRTWSALSRVQEIAAAHADHFNRF